MIRIYKCRNEIETYTTDKNFCWEIWGESSEMTVQWLYNTENLIWDIHFLYFSPSTIVQEIKWFLSPYFHNAKKIFLKRKPPKNKAPKFWKQKGRCYAIAHPPRKTNVGMEESKKKPVCNAEMQNLDLSVQFGQ